MIIYGGDLFSQRDDGWENYERALETARKFGAGCAFSTQRIVHENGLQRVVEFLRKAAEARPDAIYIHNNGVWQLAREYGGELSLIADMSLNVFNSQSLLFWRENGASGAVLSAELNMRQIERLAAKKLLSLECVVHGRAEMMVSAYCAGGSWLGGVDKGRCSFGCGKELFLLDRKGSRFPVKGDQSCRMHILNSQELCFIDGLERLVKSGVSRLRVDARYMSGERVLTVTRAYRKALDGRLPESLPDGDFTHGHYNRGVVSVSVQRTK